MKLCESPKCIWQSLAELHVEDTLCFWYFFRYVNVQRFVKLILVLWK